MNVVRHPIVAAVIAATLFGLALSLRVQFEAEKVPEIPEPRTMELSLRERQELRALEVAFAALPLSAKAVAVWDSEQGLVFGKNQHAQLPLASLTKVLLVYAGNRVLDEHDVLTVTMGDLNEEGSSGIIGGHQFLYSDLRAATMVASLNDGANAIARAIGEQLSEGKKAARSKLSAVEFMNEIANELGLVETYLYNEDGLDLGEGQPGALGSARDTALLFSRLVGEYPHTLLPTTKDGIVISSLQGTAYRYFNTNQRFRDTPGLLGSKTGYTTLAGGNLVVSFSLSGRTLTIAILGSTKEGRFDDAKIITDFLHVHPLPTK